MNPHWPPMQSNEKQRHEMPQQPFNQNFSQFQRNFPFMSQQQQQQGQFMFSNFPPFPNIAAFPYNAYVNQQPPNNIPSNNNYTFTENVNNSPGQYQSQRVYSEGRGENNQVSYERNPGQEQYASYPEGAIYRRASGPGWQRQEVFYPPNAFK